MGETPDRCTIPGTNIFFISYMNVIPGQVYTGNSMEIIEYSAWDTAVQKNIREELLQVFEKKLKNK